jgi:hypothetical protein
MGIGHLTKQFAQQAIGNQVKDVVDSFRAGESGAPEIPSGVGPVIFSQLQAMQKALKEDEELVVSCTAGGQTLRVFEVFLPSPLVAVLSGIDAERNTARILASVETLQLVCKPRAVAAPAKPNRIRFVAPKPKSE